MKWIGQHIYDLISRFRSDVYLEDVSTGTIASGGNLGLDSNNKIVKATEATGDLTSIVAGTGLSGTDLTGPIPTLNVDAAQPGITSLGTLTALDVDNININGDTITASGDLAIVATGNDVTVDTDNFVIESSTTDAPVIKLKSTSSDTKTGELIFEKLRADDGVASGQNLGAIWFRGEDGGRNTEDYAYIVGEIDVSTHGQESGSLSLGVANHDGGNGTGLKLTGGSADNEIDVVVGLGANSVTTLAGSLLIGDIAIVADGNSATVDADIFDIESATASRPRLSLTNSTNDATGAQLMFFKDKAGADGDVIGNIFFRGEDSAGTAMNFAHIIGSISESAHTDEAGKLEFKVAESDGTTTTLTTGLLIEGEHATDGEIDVTIAAGAASTTTIAGTLTMGTVATIDNDGAWVGGVIPSAKLDADTAHLAGAQTFTGTKTLNSFKGTAGATVTNILDEDAMGSASATALATQQSIKAYVDTRSSYVYQSFIGISNLATNWGIPHVNGWEAYGNQWNTDTGVSAATIGTSFTLSRYYSNVGFTVPFDGELVGFYATLRNHNADRASSVGLLHSTFSEFGGKTGTSNYTLQSVGTTSYNGGGGTSFTGGSRVIDMGREFALTAGDVIIPAILEADSDKVYFNITMVMKIDNGLTSQA